MQMFTFSFTPYCDHVMWYWQYQTIYRWSVDTWHCIWYQTRGPMGLEMMITWRNFGFEWCTYSKIWVVPISHYLWLWPYAMKWEVYMHITELCPIWYNYMPQICLTPNWFSYSLFRRTFLKSDWILPIFWHFWDPTLHLYKYEISVLRFVYTQRGD